MIMQSSVTSRYYEPSDCCFLMNQKQTALYIKHGLVLLDVLLSAEDKLVYVFDKGESRELYRKWVDHTLV